jgi:alkanesulfonate monooxygenase SsuD/methylene tetrahydromethanopterin reductase-like flavin-dependent oxidoreductase (luciferase family)
VIIMQFGISLPPFGDFADPRFLMDAARRAEAAGWDGFFLWDHMFFDPSFHPNIDPWVGLAAVATATTRMRIGTLITPIARRRPWKLARETVSVDRLSNGRLTLGVGLGEPPQWDFGFFHEETDAKLRARKLDEGLDILTGLWRGEPFRYQGEQFQLEKVTFKPTPIQQPRIPIWVGGFWKNLPPMRRAARWDGYYPIKEAGGMQPDDWREALAYIRQHRTSDAPFDLVGHTELPADPDEARARLREHAEAGVTWWMQPVNPWDMGASWEAQWQPDYTKKMMDRIERGPLKL